jgi:hypothetical protein
MAEAHDNSVEKHFHEGESTQRSLHFGRDDKGEGDASKEGGCRTETDFHHLGWAAAHDLSGRDDKGEGEASKEGGCRTETDFHHLRWAAAHDLSGRDDKGWGGASRETGWWLDSRFSSRRWAALSKSISKREHQHRDLSTSVEMTKGKVTLPRRAVAGPRPIFIALGGQHPMTSPVEMTKLL